MKRIASTLLRLLALLAAASVVIFLLLRAIPGDPARIALGLNASDEAVAELSHTCLLYTSDAADDVYQV